MSAGAAETFSFSLATRDILESALLGVEVSEYSLLIARARCSMALAVGGMLLIIVISCPISKSDKFL